MKFGRNLHQHVVPEWTDLYIDYNRLKTLLAKDSSLSDFKAVLDNETQLVENFCTLTATHLQTRLDAAAKRYHVKLGFSDAHVFDGVAKAELEDLQLSLIEVAQQLTQLEHFWRVNDEARNIIVDKASAVYGHEAVLNEALVSSQVDVATPCKPLFVLVNGTLEALHHALVDKQEQRRRSLLLERVIAKSSRRSAFTDMLLAVHEDEATALHPLTEDTSSNVKPLLRAFLQIAIVHRSLNCQQLLLSTLKSHIRFPVSEKHDYLHRIVRRLGAAGVHPEKAVLVFKDALDALSPSGGLLLESHDRRGRLPLHHAAELGLDTVCREIWARSKSWKKMLWSLDAAGATPLDLAVRSGHVDVVSSLLQHSEIIGSKTKMAVSPLLSVAIVSGFEAISKMLIAKGWGVDYTLRDGRTALHLAAAHGLTAIVDPLCDVGSPLDARDSPRGQTALMMAAVQGHEGFTKALLERGADCTLVDFRGWSAKDHAAYRGFLKIASVLGDAKTFPLTSKPSNRRGTRNILPSNSHRDESLIFVTPGTADLYKTVPFVDIAPLRAKVAPLQVPESSLWLTISAIGCKGETHSIRLPALEDRSDWPWIFRSKKSDDVKLVFRLYSQFHKGPIGTAIAMLSSLKEGLGPDRESLVRDFTLPFVDVEADFIGHVTFTFLVAKAFAGDLPVAYDQELRTPEFTEVGGHRGNGWNDGKRENLQIGENTIQSFRTAADLGATIVEFDVQLTKDHIPMIYHDFLVAEAGIDCAMHNVTYDQFMTLSKQSVEPGQGLTRLPWDERARPRHGHRRRSRSICADDGSTDAMADRMRRTFGYQGWKANFRNENIYEPFITLKQLYQNLSEDVPLSIEIKYPMLSESRDFLLDPFAPELNMVIDIILDITAAYAGPTRRITLTSFSPEICMAVAFKQSTYPVLFLNDSCNNPTGDFRATSVQTAARQAHRFGMQGVGMAAEPFVEAPGLVSFVKGQGLYTMSYGALNDDVVNSKTQAKLGLDLLIVNKVKLIKRALAEMQESEHRGRQAVTSVVIREQE